MTEAVEQLKPTLAALTQEERLSLADWIYERADEFDPEFFAEFERRRAEHESGLDPGSVLIDPELDEIIRSRTEAIHNGTAKCRPGPEVMADLRERFK